ncbi:amino acid--[acyl-carrier-protein] ligase [Tengunoibacter tsumagoiensis]|uniref:Amino acid--[acyl-carrier-protein] ligase n=1 Tax=Tengunoibacter tsumagoiensis TaxID=2014871 RepID=A0A402A137_9CHLR|nr:amino acid--[acyl-carrier-protein] ligase [Tengunoibacter tsumagoiensis]GCE12857.1 amino acid--[acyl-carrier-protein] ligase [Tengunoibacter tsumagoiensis]
MSYDTQFTESSFLQQLFHYGLLIPSTVQGVYGRSGTFEEVVTAIEARITSIGCDQQPEVMRFPPVMSRSTVEISGYMKSFPQLLGSIHSFEGTHKQHSPLLKAIEEQEDWGEHLASTNLVLTPASCYPIYATLSGTTLPGPGRTIDVSSYCFRHEPSSDPGRMQSFRQREFVRLGTPDVVDQWRRLWVGRGLEFLQSLGLHALQEIATDPFFGPGGRLLGASQQEQELKFELLAPVNSNEPQTAVVSVNYHQDHFGSKFNIVTHDGQVAHTACIGFGLERITLGLFRAHGFILAEWPAEVKHILWP